jgi:hypothetical protein
MQAMCYIGLDVHKRAISYCVEGSGTIQAALPGISNNSGPVKTVFAGTPPSALGNALVRDML